MKQTAVVFGAGGQLGVELVRVFAQRGFEVVALERARADIGDAQAVERCLAEVRPQVVLNAAAYNLVDLAEKEPEAAFRINALGVRNLAIACRDAGALLVHYSTDYVFDGRKGGPYVETDATHPLGAYAVSKLAGELYAHAYAENALVIRTCGVFGPGGRNTARGNFVETMLRLAAGGKPIRVVEDFVASPTYSPALAERTAEMVEKGAQGVYHVGGGEPISWYAYARAVFDAAGLQPDLQPTNAQAHTTPAKRPQYSALSNGRMEGLGVGQMPPLRDCLRDYFERVRAGLT